MLDNASSKKYDSNYYKSNIIIQSEIDLINQLDFDFEETTLTPDQKTAILKGVDITSTKIKIPWDNVKSLPGKVIVFEIVYKNKQTKALLTKGSYAV